MTYMTVQQAAEAWGVTVRQVQSYCTRGRVLEAGPPPVMR